MFGYGYNPLYGSNSFEPSYLYRRPPARPTPVYSRKPVRPQSMYSAYPFGYPNLAGYTNGGDDYDDGQDEYEYEYDPYVQRRRDLAEARRLHEMYNRPSNSAYHVAPTTTPQAQRFTVAVKRTARASPSPPPSSTSPRTQSPLAHQEPTSVRPNRPRSASPPSSIPTPSTVQHQDQPMDDADDAASSIQRAWRRRAALRKLRTLRRRFAALVSAFEPPAELDYTLPSDDSADAQRATQTQSVSTASVPYATFAPVSSSSDADAADVGDDEERSLDTSLRATLAYSPRTRPVHAHADALARVLSEIDAVESHADPAVRAARRALAGAVEAEAARLEAWGRAVWDKKSRAVVGTADKEEEAEVEKVVVADEEMKEKEEGGEEEEEDVWMGIDWNGEMGDEDKEEKAAQR